MNPHLYLPLTVLSAICGVSFGILASIFVYRMEDHESTPMGEQIGSARMVLGKLRKRKPMSAEELDLARKIITERTSPLAFAIPASLFCLGFFYVAGSFSQLHGHTPSFRTYVGFFPMLGSLNLTAQLLRVARLRGRLRKATAAPQHAEI